MIKNWITSTVLVVLLIGFGFAVGRSCSPRKYDTLIKEEREKRLNAEGCLVITEDDLQDVRSSADSLATELGEVEHKLKDAEIKLAAALRTGSRRA